MLDLVSVFLSVAGLSATLRSKKKLEERVELVQKSVNDVRLAFSILRVAKLQHTALNTFSELTTDVPLKLEKSRSAGPKKAALGKLCNYYKKNLKSVPVRDVDIGNLSALDEALITNTAADGIREVARLLPEISEKWEIIHESAKTLRDCYKKGRTGEDVIKPLADLADAVSWGTYDANGVILASIDIIDFLQVEIHKAVMEVL